MKILIIVALLLAAIVSASAQRRSLPPEPQKPPQMDFGPPSRTIDLIDKDTKQVVARATIHGIRIYFHNMEGKHFATIEYNKDGTRTAYDPQGQKMDPTVLPSLR